jgi:hypothetical protein
MTDLREAENCPECLGSGEVVMRLVCCGVPDLRGNCCGMREVEMERCPICGGVGFLEYERQP